VPTNEQVREAAARYAAAVGSAERETIVACFAADAEVVDPYPAPPVHGHDGIRGFWDNVFSMGTPRRFDIEHIAVAADAATFLFSLAVDVGGTLFGVRGFDVIRVDDDGLIASLTAYWEPGAMAAIEAAPEEDPAAEGAAG
jgi:steroid Delta-isomerase